MIKFDWILLFLALFAWGVIYQLMSIICSDKSFITAEQIN